MDSASSSSTGESMGAPPIGQCHGGRLMTLDHLIQYFDCRLQSSRRPHRQSPPLTICKIRAIHMVINTTAPSVKTVSR